MLTRSKSLILLLVMAVLFLSACGPGGGVLPPDPDGDDSGEDVDVNSPQESNQPEVGSATIYYHYLFKHPYEEFKVEPIIPVSIESGASPGSFTVTGIGGLNVHFRISAQSDHICNIHCDVFLRFEAVGEIQLDENTGKCIIPMSFFFVPDTEDWILETDCPDPTGQVMDCAALSVLMADPSVYTFKENDRDVTLPSDPQVTLRAEIKELIMPRGVEGICDW